MTRRGELRETLLRGIENVFGLVEPTLFHQRAAEHDLRVADLVEEVLAPREELERVPGLLLGERVLLCAEMDLRERGHRLRGVRFAAGLERDREGLLQVRDGIAGLPEEVVEATEVVEHAAEIDA